MYNRYIKRCLDFCFGMIAFLLLLPVFLLIVVAIKCDSDGPVFFKQKRIGQNKVYFDILKFRTMYISAPKDMPTHLLKNPDVFITKVGHFLRKTSLDELPQLINVIKGEMSFIGPRPALWNQEDLILERDKYHANDIRPGISGWAQIHGRDELEIPVKAKLDGYYYDHLGLWLDIRCFIGTFFSVLKHEGVVEGGTGAMGEPR